MPVSYLQQSVVFTAKHMRDSYVHVYHSIYGKEPECYHLDNQWFIVDGFKRDRNWLALEIERLRQEALVSALDVRRQQNSSRTSILKIIRRLSRL